jgi:hypothetical protein
MNTRTKQSISEIIAQYVALFQQHCPQHSIEVSRAPAAMNQKKLSNVYVTRINGDHGGLLMNESKFKDAIAAFKGKDAGAYAR